MNTHLVKCVVNVVYILEQTLPYISSNFKDKKKRME